MNLWYCRGVSDDAPTSFQVATMLTRLRIPNFKTFDDVDIELGQTTVFIGPNNSGKTAALQALTLWEIGVRLWYEKQATARATQRTGAAINRKDITAIPVPEADLLWYKLRLLRPKKESKSGKQSPVPIQIILSGTQGSEAWELGMEFEWINSESLSCRPVGTTRIPEGVLATRFAFLPAMSGLIAQEDKWERESILRRIGEGRTAEVLRNLCYRVYEANPQTGSWAKLKTQIQQQFQIVLLDPEYDRGYVVLKYRERNGFDLDVSSSGRGMLQILLLLAYLYDNPGTVLLLDEPDAHLEILRQREVYQLLTGIAREMGSQIIRATHAEEIMNKAGQEDVLIAFVGKPQRIDDRAKSQVAKALKEIRFDDYFRVIQTGWVLYLEASSDLALLQALSRRLQHPAQNMLERPFVHETRLNKPSKAREHFRGLREAKPDLAGIAIFDRIGASKLQSTLELQELQWRRKEIENYLCTRETLLAYARQFPAGERVMEAEIAALENALKILNRPSMFSPDIKASDEVLTPLFTNFFKAIGQYNGMDKTSFHILAQYIPADKIDPEVIEKLDAIVRVAESAKPAG